VTELYEGWVRHRRLVAPARSFRHRVSMTLTGDGRERTLEMPRSLGVGFNPVRFHFELDGERVRSLAAEVTNTPWGERRTYRFEGRDGRADKAMHVSPFMAMDHEYLLHATAPGERLTIHIESRRAGEAVFDATLALVRRPPGAGGRLRRLGQPLRVLALIYAHAAVLALRGATYHPHPDKELSMSKDLKSGDKVRWNTPQGKTHGRVKRKLTADTKVEGQQIRASESEPRYLVVSDKTGAEAAHAPEALERA
jgi:DUF1365 family protein